MKVTILILIDGFLQYSITRVVDIDQDVTILILIDGFLQSKKVVLDETTNKCHNPYFNRWFSAILMLMKIGLNYLSHNPYFNRWFSAITLKKM